MKFEEFKVGDLVRVDIDGIPMYYLISQKWKHDILGFKGFGYQGERNHLPVSSIIWTKRTQVHLDKELQERCIRVNHLSDDDLNVITDAIFEYMDRVFDYIITDPTIENVEEWQGLNEWDRMTDEKFAKISKLNGLSKKVYELKKGIRTLKCVHEIAEPSNLRLHGLSKKGIRMPKYVYYEIAEPSNFRFRYLSQFDNWIPRLSCLLGGLPWEEVYNRCLEASIIERMPMGDAVIKRVLEKNGYTEVQPIDNDIYLRDFVISHQKGQYFIRTYFDGYAVIGGAFYDDGDFGDYETHYSWSYPANEVKWVMEKQKVR